MGVMQLSLYTPKHFQNVISEVCHGARKMYYLRKKTFQNIMIVFGNFLETCQVCERNFRIRPMATTAVDAIVSRYLAVI